MNTCSIFEIAMFCKIEPIHVSQCFWIFHTMWTYVISVNVNIFLNIALQKDAENVSYHVTIYSPFGNGQISKRRPQVRVARIMFKISLNLEAHDQRRRWSNHVRSFLTIHNNSANLVSFLPAALRACIGREGQVLWDGGHDGEDRAARDAFRLCLS